MDERVSGIIGKRDLVVEFAKGIIFQLAALHSYDECKLVFIYDKEEILKGLTIKDITIVKRWMLL
jgi:DNA segregation ATPase FtsK/SpoIIIE, S-DNA-T family